MAAVATYAKTAIQFYDASDSCPFAAKAWLTLIEKGIEFERQTIDLKNKPKHFTELYASINPDSTARAKVPLIVGERHRKTDRRCLSDEGVLSPGFVLPFAACRAR